MSNVEMMIAQVCDDAEKIWFYDNSHHCICFSDCNFDEVHVEKKIDICNVENLGTGIGIFKLNHKLYITFQRKSAVLVYLMQTKEYEIILSDDNSEKNFYNVEKNREKIFFLPQKVNGKIFVFDMQRENFEQIIWMDKNCIQSGWRAFFLFRENEKVFLPTYNKELLFELNLSNYKYVIHKYEGVSIGSICRYQDTTWIAQTDSAGLVSIENPYLKKVCKYNSDSIGGRDFFSKLFIYNEKMVGIPRFGDYVLIVDPLNGKATRLYHDALKRNEKNTMSLTYGYYGVGHLLYLLPWGTLKLLCVDIEKTIIYEKKIEVSVSDYFKYFYRNPGRDNDMDAFKDYLNWIVLKDNLNIKNGDEDKQDKYAGELIHETMKKNIFKYDI